MKLSKYDGIMMLKEFAFPTVELLSLEDIIKASTLNEGVSVRVFTNSNNCKWNVFLPSIHNCKDINLIKEFCSENSKYKILIHKTVKPEYIFSFSKLIFSNSIVIESYKNFCDYAKGIIDGKMVIPIDNDRIWISLSTFVNTKQEQVDYFYKIAFFIKTIPYKEYNGEAVVENGKILFTELTVQ